MLRYISTTLGSAMAALCLISTLAIAQSQNPSPPIPPAQNPTVYQEKVQNPSPAQAESQTMTCIKDDGMGNCTAARGSDGKDMVVVGTKLKTGDTMTCVDRQGVVHCQPAS
jgi:hypothetical protein